MGRTMHAIVYDAIHDEFVVPQPFGQAILTFRGDAEGEEPPIRVIQGLRTRLRAPDRLEVDPVNNEILVPQQDSVLVFPREASGNVAPLRELKGPDTQMGSSAVAVDPVHDLLIVAGRKGGNNTTLKIFGRTDEGNVKPRAVIGGPNTGLTTNALIRVFPPRGEILAVNRGVYGEQASSGVFVGVWSVEDDGDVPPRWTIGGPNGMLRQPRGMALDPKNKSVIISDKYLNAILTYYFPEIF